MYSIFITNDMRGRFGTSSCFVKKLTMAEAKREVVEAFRNADYFYPYRQPCYAEIYDQETTETIFRVKGEDWQKKESAA